MSSQFSSAVNEKDVENLYRHSFMTKFKDMEITSPFGCDGFGISKLEKLRVLFEFKDNLDLSNKFELCKVLAQSIYYIKKFYNAGMVPPSTIFIADRNECVALHVNDVLDYLDMDLDWNLAPSSAHRNGSLMTKLVQDENIKPFVFNSKDLQQCVDKVKDLTDNVQRKVLVTDHNIPEVFRYFDNKVLGKTKLTTNEKANLFVQMLVNKDENFLHPVNRRKTVMTKSFGEIPIESREGFESFFAHFASSYSPSQKHKLAAVVDRIVEDTTRRRQGEFFTPAIWVDKAHEYITSVYGQNWKEEYVVWDPAWGTGNLTRDYQFKELYSSTLHQSDIDTANQMGYNSEAVKFQYDFLNDEYEKLPEGLRNAIECGRKIIVLMNPPYGRSNEGGRTSTIEKGAASTLISKEMKNTKMGPCTAQLYAQFIYRLCKLGISNICFFSTTKIYTGKTFSLLRKLIHVNSEFKNGFIINASEFADVKEWALSFGVFAKRTESTNPSQKIFKFEILTEKNFLVESQGNKVVYNTEGLKTLGEWTPKGSLVIGNLVSHNNNVAKGVSDVYFTNEKVTGGVKQYGVDLNNFFHCTMNFFSRRVIQSDWLNQNDEFLAPKDIEETIKFDSIVYSLFNNSSYQKSQQGSKNEFFWMSKERMKELADNNGYDNLYNDVRTSSDRYVYKLLFGEERIYDRLSNDAKLVLDKATDLVERSMELRQLMANNENHLDSWDAGYAQLKIVWKEYFTEDFKEFRQLYKNLEDRMRPLVYELGFLMK